MKNNKIIILMLIFSISVISGCQNNEKKENKTAIIVNETSSQSVYSGFLKYRNILIKLEPYEIMDHKVKIAEYNLLMSDKQLKGDINYPAIVKDIKLIYEYANRKSLSEGLIPVYENGKINNMASGYRLPLPEEIYFAYNFAKENDGNFEMETIGEEEKNINKKEKIVEFLDEEKLQFEKIKSENQEKIKLRAMKSKKYDLYSGTYFGIENKRTLKEGGLDEVTEGGGLNQNFGFRLVKNLSFNNEREYSIDVTNIKYSVYQNEDDKLSFIYPENWGITYFVNSNYKIRNSLKKTDPTVYHPKGVCFYLPQPDGKNFLYRFSYYVYEFNIKENDVEKIKEKLSKETGIKEFFNYFKENEKYYFMVKSDIKNEEVFFIVKNNKCLEISFATCNSKTVFPKEIKESIIEKLYIE